MVLCFTQPEFDLEASYLFWQIRILLPQYFFLKKKKNFWVSIYHIFFATKQFLQYFTTEAHQNIINLASILSFLQICQCCALKIIVVRGSVLSQGISSLELTTQRPCLLHFDKMQCLERMDFNPIPCAPKWLFGKCFCHLNARSQKVMLAAEEKKPLESDRSLLPLLPVRWNKLNLSSFSGLLEL